VKVFKKSQTYKDTDADLQNTLASFYFNSKGEKQNDSTL
jgi:hypothetical protein